METTAVYEVTTDELTLEASKADTAITFLQDWSRWIAEIIAVIKDFFDKISGALAK